MGQEKVSHSAYKCTFILRRDSRQALNQD
uniref:Uncharacterized protein n=1 Tax=Rhizophora mucronata TaxID=61149 RepID=A0A2P2QVB0_RHIMU